MDNLDEFYNELIKSQPIADEMNNLDKFYALIDSSTIADKLNPYFDRDRNKCDLAKIRYASGCWSHGEQLLCSFFVCLWMGQEEEGWFFDYISALKILDFRGRKIVVEWGANPYWP